MDWAAIRRTPKSWRENQDPPLHAVIIGEPFASCGTDGHGFPLSPVTPSRELPFAMLPVCNTPIIDYILENLVANGVHEVTLLLNPSSVELVQTHLTECRTARGKPWMSSDTIKVTVLKSVRNMTKLSDAVSEIRDSNAVPQSGSFLFVPIECISVFGNLRECYIHHLERVKKVGKYAATVLCTSARHNLEDTLHNVLERALFAQKSDTSPTRDHRPTSPSLIEQDYASPLQEVNLTEYAHTRTLTVPSHPKEHHTMFVVNKATNVVTYMARLEPADEMPEPPVVVFNRKEQLIVRMDLIPTGFVFFCCEALALIEFHIRDMYNFLSTSLLGQVEIFGNVFGIMEIPSSNAIIEPVSSREHYLKANLDVCARRLFPLTREYCFAEAQAKYAVSSSCETTYLHTSAKVASQSCGPNVVVGEGVYVPPTAELVGAVCGTGVKIGEGTSIVGCVLHEGAVIGENCTLRGSIIGAHAIVKDGADISCCIVGPHCVIGQMGEDTNGGGIVLHNQSIVSSGEIEGAHAPVTDGETRANRSNNNNDSSSRSRSTGAPCASVGNETDHWLVGRDGKGKAVVERWVDTVLPTYMLFTLDPIPKAVSDDDDESDEEDDEHEVFYRHIKRHVETALQDPTCIEGSSYDMSTVCLSHGFGYPELCEVVTELLMEHVLRTCEESDGDDPMKVARSIFGQWCRPFYNRFLSQSGEMNIDAMVSTLEGVCAAVCDPKCIMHNRCPQLLELLYNGCDDEMYDMREYCIVSGEGLIAFDKVMERRRETLIQYTGFGHQLDACDESDASSDDALSRNSKEEGKVLLAQACHEFIMGVKDFLEEADG